MNETMNETYEMNIIQYFVENQERLEICTGGIDSWHQYYDAKIIGSVLMERNVGHYLKIDNSPIYGHREIRWSVSYGGSPIKILENFSKYRDNDLLQKLKLKSC